MKVAYRVKSNEDFKKVVHNGRFLKCSSFVAHCLANDLNHSRVGISTSTKLGNAVTRNRIRRQIRSMCDALIDYDKANIDLVIIVKKDYLNKNFQENKELLARLINEAGLLK